MRLRLKIAALFACFVFFLLFGALLSSVALPAYWVLDMLVFGAMAVILVLAPGLQRISGWFVLGAGVVLLVLFKVFTGWNHGPVWSTWGIYLVELFFLVMITYLSYEVSFDLGILQSQVRAEAYDTAVPPALDSETGVRLIRQEMVVSRRYERPLSLILFQTFPYLASQNLAASDGEAAQRAHDARLPTALHQSITRHLRPGDKLFIERRGNRYAIVCPETAVDDATQLADALAQALAIEYGFRPTCAVASFPQDGLTFNKLLERTAVTLDGTVQDNKFVQTLLPSSNAIG